MRGEGRVRIHKFEGFEATEQVHYWSLGFRRSTVILEGSGACSCPAPFRQAAERAGLLIRKRRIEREAAVTDRPGSV